ncbi:MAG: hypothetical protein K6G79_04160 [Bacteroidales bacterium]|nr:hypothetical protein [Bacteroidales bacterium]
MRITEENKERIIRWLLSDMEPREGRLLLAEIHPNRRLARNAQRMSASMAAYELKALLGIPKEALFTQKCSNNELINRYVTRKTGTEKRITAGNAPRGNAAGHAAQGKKEKARPRVPADDHLLLQAKEAVAELAVEASKLHNALFETGEVNNAKNNKARAEMLEALRKATDLKEAIWEEKEKYCDTGVAGRELKDLVEAYYNKSESGNEDTEDIRKKDTAWLLKRKENVRKYITKCRNRLEYGTKTAQAEKRPMPPGPERAKTQKRLDEYIAELEKLNKELERRGT